MAWRTSADPQDPDDAIEWFRSKTQITDREYAELDDRSRNFAFSAAGATRLDLVSQLFDALDRALSEGTTLQDFKREIGKSLVDQWGHGEAPHLETIFRTNVMSAYSAGRWVQMNDPEVKKVRPWGRLSAVLDTRICPTCEELSGLTLPLDSPEWLRKSPPFHFNDRCEIENLTEEEARGGTPDDKIPNPPILAGFGRIPLEGPFEPDFSTKPSEVVRVFKERQGRNALPPPSIQANR